MTPTLPLQDIHLPVPGGWWPPAPGWWLLAALILGLVVWLVHRLHRLWRRRRKQRMVLRRFDELANTATLPARERLTALLALLRRAAIASHPHSAGLSGEDWLRFLDGTTADRPFSTGTGRVLLDAPYRPAVDAAELATVLPLMRQRLRDLVEAGGPDA